ncbi:MAG: DNA mismatch repair protein MutS [Firmicutes bacterium HGW-Firmicutes-7]|nr:MAG: DNA mismatch repair protein MutS [Firmicutes bacterium HGW-Firmicutes-7]
MMQQYFDLKDQYKDCILFFRLGDFYEMFFEDAKLASKALEITLTGRDCGQEERAPMCGVPHHAAENYINKLILKGFKVAICEQVENPKDVKGIVKRDVVRIVTPGTNLNMQSLDASKNNYLMCIFNNVVHFGVAYVDITTGDFYTTSITGEQKLIDEVSKVSPTEIIIDKSLETHLQLLEMFSRRFNAYVGIREDWSFDKKRCTDTLQNHFQMGAIEGLGLSGHTESLIASGALLDYLFETQKGSVKHITKIHYYDADDYMVLDLSTRRNLEIVETLREKERRGSLLWVLDKTKTAMGARMLRSFLEQPLKQIGPIQKRLDAVEELLNQPIVREEIKESLSPVYDLERLMSKISCQTANSRDLIAFKQSLGMLPYIKAIINKCTSPLLQEISGSFDTLEDLFFLIDQAIEEEPPISIKEGHIIKTGYHDEVDRLRAAGTDGKEWLAALEMQEREATGIKSLKINYNKVFGYYIEITKSYLHMVPENRYTRKQTLANAERYITPELKEMENTILGAEEKVVALEYELFLIIRNQLAEAVERIKTTSVQVSLVDVLQSLSEVASKQNFTRPKVDEGHIISIKDGRHPVVEKMMNNDLFITNNTFLDSLEHRFSIITGPNMAGKSTYMRQVALIVLMAQMGSFVPASEATIGVVDRIFTRVGASDDLASGQSTFMVEMTEVANILRNATKHSLIILDEIGRGTSTFDGLSIAWAVVEYLVGNNIIGAKSLFATHYHELTELEGTIDGVVNYCISVKEKGDDIIFLRKIIPGGADKSYGIQVAKLAGVPEDVIVRAKEILQDLTDADIATHTSSNKIIEPKKEQSVQLNLFNSTESEVVNMLKNIQLNHITPIEALTLLSELQNKVIK